MKRFNVSYVEVTKDGNTISSCYDSNDGNFGRNTYGSILNNSIPTPDIFHKLIHDMVLPKVIPVIGNKVTKVSLDLIDGFDCYYTTDEDDKVLICFTQVDIPKILPIRLLSELKGEKKNNYSNNELGAHVGKILDEFHEELMSYKNDSGQEGDTTEDDIQDIIKIMNNNIDKFLERQERISLLVDKTSQLNDNSHNFKKKAARIKERMWWQRMKNTTLLMFAIILTISALFIFFYVI
ncbi:Nyv1p NDAI_0B02040 [Naumovozyma dairenensis CBS 421]|uniref:V-SNARE coiled-coil homology domain-containing protein n=1 Tax=Naumovozyma dairenensis (strain ATCC 10597 / BCRC 20456 / CBS 421 / NBRC 0211 / NRRL Y-12639) TaxID=1071378 RepID=G0W628_NAUDC|nr:hypothetical protein NDAI_0B02040 [Naumovozyma dairenensis CBS 421]CCD23239.1 hypothetical protein NDAI_0B02040 [Naumovozyma dairenensis CBS 421]